MRPAGQPASGSRTQASSGAAAEIRGRVRGPGRHRLRRCGRVRHHQRVTRIAGGSGRPADGAWPARGVHGCVPDSDHGGARRPAAVAGALSRPGSAHPLAPSGQPVGDRPDHGSRGPDHARICAGGQVPGAGRDLAPAALLSRHSGGGCRVRPARAGRDHLVPGGSAQAAVRDLVGCPSLPLHRARAGLRPSDRDRGELHRPSARARACGSPSGRVRPAWCWRSGSASLPGGACGISSASSRSGTRLLVSISVICRGRDLDRLPVSGGQFFLWRFLARDLWWQAHPTRCPRCRSLRTCASQ